MLKEVIFCVEALESYSIYALERVVLPGDLHAWFTTRVLTVGNVSKEVKVSRLQLTQFIESAETWIAVNQDKEQEAELDIDALKGKVLILKNFLSLSRKHRTTFYNCAGAKSNE